MSQSTATPRRADERAQLSRALERIVDGPKGRGVIRLLYPIVRPTVARECEPALRGVISALRDEQRAVAPESLDAVRRFVTEGAASPLYGPSAAAAAAAARALELRVQAA